MEPEEIKGTKVPIALHIGYVTYKFTCTYLIQKHADAGKLCQSENAPLPKPAVLIRPVRKLHTQDTYRCCIDLSIWTFLLHAEGVFLIHTFAPHTFV